MEGDTDLKGDLQEHVLPNQEIVFIQRDEELSPRKIFKGTSTKSNRKRKDWFCYSRTPRQEPVTSLHLELGPYSPSARPFSTPTSTTQVSPTEEGSSKSAPRESVLRRPRTFGSVSCFPTPFFLRLGPLGPPTEAHSLPERGSCAKGSPT